MRPMAKRTTIRKPLSTGSADELARAHARLEAQVINGQRDSRSLILIPATMARDAKVTFVPNAFGGPKAW